MCRIPDWASGSSGLIAAIARRAAARGPGYEGDPGRAVERLDGAGELGDELLEARWKREKGSTTASGA